MSLDLESLWRLVLTKPKCFVEFTNKNIYQGGGGHTFSHAYFGFAELSLNMYVI